ncbi:hypothetical protein FB597_104344 [Herbaspirillum sp. SJZ099]|nr:hypothetical protein FB597_104344 [Herbaspirillum sp. SJZ099]
MNTNNKTKTTKTKRYDTQNTKYRGEQEVRNMRVGFRLSNALIKNCILREVGTKKSYAIEYQS